MKYSFMLIAFAFVYKVAVNTYRFFRTKKLFNLYKKWTHDKNFKFLTYKSECLKLFKSANVDDLTYPASERIEFSQYAQFNVSIFVNFPSNTRPQASATVRIFSEAIGEYRRRLKETFSPIYWINIIVFLPRNLLDYLGLPKESVSYKISNLLLTALWWIACSFLLFFRDKWKDVVTDLLEIIP